MTQTNDAQPAGSDLARAADEKQRNRYRAGSGATTPEALMTWFTFSLVVVAIVQAWCLFDANKVAQRSAAAAKEAADAAVVAANATKASVEVAQDTARKQLRAYVSVIKGQVTGINSNEPIKIHLTIKNSGQTPSSCTEISACIQCAPYPSGPTYTSGPINQGIPTSLATGEEVYLDQPLNVGSADRERLRTKTMAIYASGCVAYKDIFNEEHTECFTLMQGGAYDLRSPLMGITPPPEAK